MNEAAVVEDPKSVEEPASHDTPLDTMFSDNETESKAPDPPPTPEKDQEGGEKGKVEEESDKDKNTDKKEGEEEKAAGAEKEAEPEVEDKWDSEENPYKSRHKSASDELSRLAQENINLKKDQDKKLDIINKKLDGDYDSEVEAEKEAAEVKAAEDKADADFNGRFNASKTTAIGDLGEDFVNKKVLNPDSEFNQMIADNPAVELRVAKADAPVLEAIKVVEEANFFKKHGGTPKKIEESILSKFKEIELPKLREEITKEIMDNLNNKEAQPGGLREVRGDDKKSASTGKADESLSAIFSD